MKVYFPGKFQPPHIGHIITISKIIKQYKNVIIGITCDDPRIVDPNEVKEIFQEIFWNAHIEYHVLEGTLTKGEGKLPNFDLLLSGNRAVLDWGLKNGYAVKEVSRSEGIGQSGREIRRLLNDKNENDSS